MSVWVTVSGVAGGVGLFLLGMWLMTEGLKLSAGAQLEQLLARATRSRLRGLTSGALVTAVVQSSSAVTIATIGFVNAGLLNLPQALWVLFGANVGATMTGWLVALVGLKFGIELLALPLVGVGMVMRLLGEGNRRGALGMALAGLGVLFIGIDVLQQTFATLASDLRLPAGTGLLDILLQVAVGVLLTVLMQSSSAALAVALSAAQGGMVTPEGAAAIVIGTNVGTTVKAMIAALGATSNARRAAAAHVLFNVVTRSVALALLPWLLAALAALRDALGLAADPAAKLALFHTCFNLLGVALIWPLAGRLTAFLEARFRTAEEDEAQPRHLDSTVLLVPVLALDALDRELRRLGSLSLRLVGRAFGRPAPDAAAMQRSLSIVQRLQQSIADFVVQVNRSGMSQASAHRLAEILGVARYYEFAAELATHGAGAWRSQGAVETAAEREFRARGLALVLAVEPDREGQAAEGIEPTSDAFEAAYDAWRSDLLQAGLQGRMPVAQMDAALDAASSLRRAAHQGIKAIRLLSPERPGPQRRA